MKRIFAILAIILLVQMVFVTTIQLRIQHWENVASVESDIVAILKERIRKEREVREIRMKRKQNTFDTVGFKTLAKTIYFESAGEGLAGMVSVSQVVMERVNDCTFPSNIKQVVYQPNQFEWTFDTIPNELSIENKIDAKAWERAQMVALAFLTAEEPIVNEDIRGANLYHSVKVHPYWANHPRVTFIKKVRNHLYYKEKRRKCSSNRSSMF